MNNVEKCKQLGILGDIRQRLGAEDENSTSYDSQINKMTNDKIMQSYSGWNHGDPYFWINMRDLFNSLENFNKNNKSVKQLLEEEDIICPKCGSDNIITLTITEKVGCRKCKYIWLPKNK